MEHMQRSYINDSQLPLVIEPEGGNTYTCSKSSLHDFLTAERGSLETDLTKHGAILFRGFDLLSPEDFSDVFDRFLGDKKAKSYRSGGGNKSKVLRNVYTST